jgi:MATE family multidrug resistance protein
LLTLPAAVIVWYAPHFLAITEKNSDVIRDAALLLHSLVWALPGVFLYMVFREYIAAFNLSRMTMLVAIFSIPLTFVVNYVFIYGKLGLPAFGIAGIGYGGACVMWFMFIVLALYCKHHTVLKKHLPRWYELKWHTGTIRSMLRVGVPSGTIYVLDSGMFTFGAMLVGHFSTTALAAYQITMQCASAVYSIPFGVSIATALQVGHAMGAKEFVKAKQFVYAGLSVGLIAAVGIALIFVFSPHLLVRFFIHPQVKHFAEISQYAASFFIAVALFQCFDAVQAILNGALRGLKDTFVPMIMSVGCYWVLGVGSAYYFSFHTTLKATGVLYGLTIGVISAAIALSLRFRDQQIKNMI